MKTFRIEVMYDGARYKGWQRLGNTDMTIQGKLEGVLETLIGKGVEVPGASRTDAGVHAYGQVAHCTTKAPVTADEIYHHLNRYLPDDILVQKVEEVARDFHSRHHSTGKTYVYQIWNKEYVNPFARKTHVHEPRKMSDDKIREAATFFKGRHDFTAFTTAKSKKKSMVRTIESISVTRDSEVLRIEVQGSGFLHNQVRRMVGLLLDIGAGEREPSDVKHILESKDRKSCGVTADPRGLFLKKVHY